MNHVRERIINFVTEMKEKQSARLAVTLADVMNFIGGVSGLLALGAIVFWGGALVEKVRTLDTRVTGIELRGSDAVREHARMDDERFTNLKDNVATIQSSISVISDMRADLRVVAKTVQNVERQLEKHMEEKK